MRSPSTTLRRALSDRLRHDQRRYRDDSGLTLVELLVAFTVLILLIGIVATAVTAYLQAGTTVLSSYNAADQLLPSSTTVQRLLRSEVQPAPQASDSVAPTPPFLTSNVGAYGNTFYANVGPVVVKGTTYYGPVQVVMAISTPTKCASCKLYTSVFTVTQQPPDPNTCPTSVSSTKICKYTTVPVKTLVDVTGVSNLQTGSPSTSTPIFSYNTLDLYQSPPSYTGGVTSFTSCQAPTLDGNGNPTSSNCPANDIQSVGVDLQVYVPGSPVQENSFVVYRLSSFSFLFSTVVG
jgi:Tfp pilus assembly protein PilV